MQVNKVIRLVKRKLWLSFWHCSILTFTSPLLSSQYRCTLILTLGVSEQDERQESAFAVMESLQSYDLNIQHIARKDNVVADALSRE